MAAPPIRSLEPRGLGRTHRLEPENVPVYRRPKIAGKLALAILLFLAVVTGSLAGLLLVRERGFEWWGYLWLLAGSAYFLARCLFDLSLVQRPALSPNLNLGGLATMAGVLFISENTVKNHVRNILEKLHLHSRMEAVTYAWRKRLLDPRDHE